MAVARPFASAAGLEDEEVHHTISQIDFSPRTPRVEAPSEQNSEQNAVFFRRAGKGKGVGGHPKAELDGRRKVELRRT